MCVLTLGLMTETLIKTNRRQFFPNQIKLIIYAKNLIIFFTEMIKTIIWCSDCKTMNSTSRISWYIIFCIKIILKYQFSFKNSREKQKYKKYVTNFHEKSMNVRIPFQQQICNLLQTLRWEDEEMIKTACHFLIPFYDNSFTNP